MFSAEKVIEEYNNNNVHVISIYPKSKWGIGKDKSNSYGQDARVSDGTKTN